MRCCICAQPEGLLTALTATETSSLLAAAGSSSAKEFALSLRDMKVWSMGQRRWALHCPWLAVLSSILAAVTLGMAATEDRLELVKGLVGDKAGAAVLGADP